MKKELSISAIEHGTVIDHIPSDATFKVVEILKLDRMKDVVSIAMNLPSKKSGIKGIIKIGGRILSKEEVDKIAIVAPHATVNIIKDYDVKEKLDVALPESIKNIIKCSNPNCVTNVEKVKSLFYILEKKPLKVKCHYCERFMNKEDVEIL